MLRVIQFVRSEKYGIKIPLNNVNDRLCAILGVSSRSIDSLKKELKEIETSQEESSRRRLRSGSSTCTTVRKSSMLLILLTFAINLI